MCWLKHKLKKGRESRNGVGPDPPRVNWNWRERLDRLLHLGQLVYQFIEGVVVRLLGRRLAEHAQSVRGRPQRRDEWSPEQRRRRDDARRRNQQRLSTGSNASAASVEKVLEACEETARAVASPNAEGRRIQRLFDDVCGVRKGTKALDALALRLKADETLLRARATRCGPKVYDGASVLHAAAFHGQLHVIEAVLAIDESPLDPWTLDTAGRTALHVAAERGHVSCCEALRKAMSADRDDPVGENAPLDMSGRTPCAWAAERVKDAQKRDALEAALFSPGDATVLPRRSETSHAAHAVSSTAGWRVVMEDAHCVCRLDGATLYAVFDGHGGSLVANYAAANIERCLQLSEDPAASLKDALSTLDAELEQHPRLVKSRRSGRGGTGPLVAEDESGATALLCLVTRTEVVVAHLGDSRGALLKKQGGTWSSQNLTPADHTAGSPAEAARVDSLQNFGVLRRENDAPRVARKVDGAVVENGALQTTRALGDFVFKTATERAVTCEADARALPLEACRGGERSCVLLACDGLWDVLTGEECGAILDSCVGGLDAQCDALVAEWMREVEGLGWANPNMGGKAVLVLGGVIVWLLPNRTEFSGVTALANAVCMALGQCWYTAYWSIDDRGKGGVDAFMEGTEGHPLINSGPPAAPKTLPGPLPLLTRPALAPRPCRSGLRRDL